MDAFLFFSCKKNKIRFSCENKMGFYDLGTKPELREHIEYRDDLLADMNPSLYLWTFYQP